MIIGVGTDLCDIRRIEQTLARFDVRFTAHLYRRQ
jgi:holo-[acyl-carrier protein] synthase